MNSHRVSQEETSRSPVATDSSIASRGNGPDREITEDELRLKKAMQSITDRKRAMCAPDTFRCTKPTNERKETAHWGQIRMGKETNRTSKFLHLSDTPTPLYGARRSLSEYVSSVIDMMELHWNMVPASVLLSITGGAQDFQLSPMLQSAFSHGIAAAARATKAWLISGGTDSGVMGLVGRALEDYSDDSTVTCVGIATYGVINERKRLESSRSLEQITTLERTSPNSASGVNLERNHTHFLLVDNEKEAPTAWGGEIALRFALEAEYCRRKKVPRVLIVVQGGPKTLESVHEAVMSDCPVVLVADSGGVASMLHQYLMIARDETDPNHGVGKVPEAFQDKYSNEAASEMLIDIARREQQVSSFLLGEGSSSGHTSGELDLHILNAILSDSVSYKPEMRLKLAVEWNRLDVVRRVLQNDFLDERARARRESAAAVERQHAGEPRDEGELDVSDAMRQALQCAIENRRVEIIKELLHAAASISDGQHVIQLKIDFLELYSPRRHDAPRIFKKSQVLARQYASRAVIEMRGRETDVATYHTVLGEFLGDYCPDMKARLAHLLKLEAERRGGENGHGGHGEKGAAPGEGGLLTFSDLMLWAVLIRDVSLAEVFWSQGGHGHVTRGDPIRLALLAAQASTRAAERSTLERDVYRHNAQIFEDWACELLRRCENESSANTIGKLLLRPHSHWPHTVLRVAMRGHRDGCKKFIGQNLVQDLVDNQWRGRSHRRAFELPEDVTYLRILRHLLDRNIKMERSGMRTKVRWENRRRPSRQRDRFGPPFVSLQSSGPAELHPYRQLSDSHQDKELFTDDTADAAASFEEFLKVPQVKFFLKLISYGLFLLIYILVLLQHRGIPAASFSALDGVFFLWAFALLVEEFHQWQLDARRGEQHLVRWIPTTSGETQAEFMVWNIIDVFTLSLLLAVFIMRLIAVGLCSSSPMDPTTEPLLINASKHEALHSRELRGGGGDGVFDSPLLGDDYDYPAVWLELYGSRCGNESGRIVLWLSQVLLSLNVVPCFLRVLNWMTVWEDLGILSVVLIELLQDVKVFLLIFGLVVIGFASAFVGLMPSLGSGEGGLSDRTFMSAGPFQAAFWATYGEFGDLEAISLHGSFAGTSLLWIYAFTSQILLVNLLIAMMTETYQKIKKDAKNEYRFQRILIVDEFMGSVFHIPPPISLPILLYHLCGSFLTRWLPRAWRGMEQGLPRLNQDTEDLLTYTLPKDEAHARHDLHALKQLTDEKRKKKHDSVETTMMDSQEALRKMMLQTQDKTHKLERKITFLLKQASEAMQDAGVEEADLVAYEMSEGSISSHATAAAATPPASVGLSRRSNRRASVKAVLAASDLSGGQAGASPSVEAAGGGGVRSAIARSPSVPDLTTSMRGGEKEFEDELTGKLHAELRDCRNELTKAQIELRRRDARVHQKARSQEIAIYPPRFHVPDDKVEWSKTWKEYAPIEFTSKVVYENDSTVKRNGWADPKEPTSISPEEWQNRLSYEGDIVFTAHGRPRNPRGRTGIGGRGLLGKWGPNHAADPIVTRFDPARPMKLQMVAIKRTDTVVTYEDGTQHAVWAIPGGMVDAGETVSTTVRREFAEEAGNHAGKAQKARFDKLAEELFESGSIVYRGYVDDPRSTDHAWIETTAFHFHCSAELGAMLPLQSGGDSAAVMWLDIDPNEPKYVHLHASHRVWVDSIRDKFRSGTFA